MFSCCYSCYELYAGKVLGMLGNVQLDLQKLVDGYVSFCWAQPFDFLLEVLFIYKNFYDDSIPSVPQRSHVALTITRPSESLLNELRTVEVCLCTFLFIKFVYLKHTQWLMHICILFSHSVFAPFNLFQYFNFILLISSYY